MKIRKSILAFFFLAYTSVAYPSSAVGLATGPSLGIAGFYTTFKEKNLKISIDNLALQIGWFAQLDLWLLYAKLDGLFVLDWYRLPNTEDSNCFKYIQAPLTIGMPVFNIFRPHIGLIFRIPLGELYKNEKFKANKLIESYKKKINGYTLGIGIALGDFLIDIDFELGQSRLDKKSISSRLADRDRGYRPKQLALKIHYNLLG
ncbi:hypothetical protein [Candidatus Cardinium hertigii]|uniref:hypothetical protein n=1 Tax=Candidatus Cardinium hertigii TaxID=247481 RepID=UPI003D7E59CE